MLLSNSFSENLGAYKILTSGIYPCEITTFTYPKSAPEYKVSFSQPPTCQTSINPFFTKVISAPLTKFLRQKRPPSDDTLAS